MGRKKSEGFTKQGVRDLNSLAGKSVGIVLPAPPVPVACKHKNKKTVAKLGLYWVQCGDCGETLGDPW